MKNQRNKISVSGTSKRPRLMVFRSNKGIYAQIIDDTKGVSLLSLSFKNVDKKLSKGKTGVELAALIGQELAKKAKSKKIVKVVFDKRRYKYHGQVKALAEGARKGGLKF